LVFNNKLNVLVEIEMTTQMRPTVKLCLALLVVLLLAGGSFVTSSVSSQTRSGAVKALVGGTLIDGYGSKPIRNSVVLIEGERIKAVGQVGTIVIPAGAEIISTEGMSVMPGLWDMHVHLMINGHSDYTHWDKTYPPQMEKVIMPASAKQLLMAGVTSARDLGAPLEASIAVRDRIRKGEIPGPTLYVSGPFIQHEPYPGTDYVRWGVKGVDDARAKVKKLADAGVDVIKLIDQDQMAMEEVQAVVDEAHKRRLPVVAHSHRPEEIRRGLLVGVDCFEHTGLATAPEYPADIIAMIRERTAKMSLGPLFWTPTVQGLLNYEYVRDNPEQLDDPSWQVGLPQSIVDDIKASLKNPGQLSYYQITPLRRPTLQRKIQQLSESGVVLLIGTDSGIPMNFHSQTTWRELDAWVNSFGIDAMVAIRAATYWPSVAMKVSDQVGTVSEGKYADIIAVRGDVLRHIDLLQNVDIVIKHGKRYR
jgi:imidazolonepropionase-like amidohydrolase